MSLSPKSFYSQDPVPEAKNLVIDLEKRTIPYLSDTGRIRVIDPFNQMKREYNTVKPVLSGHRIKWTVAEVPKINFPYLPFK